MTSSAPAEHFAPPGVLRQTWIVSNRGPGEYHDDRQGGTELKWQPGGLSMVLIPPALKAAQSEGTGREVFWLAAAKTAGDIAHADDGLLESAGPDQGELSRPVHLRFLELTEDEQRLYYGVFSNTVLWMTNHGMDHDLSKNEIEEAWDSYRRVNERFARYVVDHAEDGAIIQVHDYQMALVGGLIQELAQKAGKQLDVVGFWHISFAELPQLLRGFEERRNDCTRTQEFLKAMGAIPLGFHRDQWAERFCAAHTELLGTQPAAGTFVMPAFVDVDNLRNESRRREVRAAMDTIYEELFELNGNKRFTGKIIGTVGRADPKNGMDRLLEAYELLLMDDTVRDKPALVMNVAPTRLDVALYRDHWQGLLRKKESIERHYPHARILLRFNVTKSGKPSGKPRADAVATFRIADVVAVLSRAGGRDIVGQEAVALKNLAQGDAPSVAVLSAEAGTSDTLIGIVSAESRPTGYAADGTVSERAISGSSFRSGAVIVRDIGPGVDNHLAALRCAVALKQSLIMSGTEVAERFAVMNELLTLEDPDIWYGELMVRSQHDEEVIRRYERGAFKNVAYGTE